MLIEKAESQELADGAQDEDVVRLLDDLQKAISPYQVRTRNYAFFNVNQEMVQRTRIDHRSEQHIYLDPSESLREPSDLGSSSHVAIKSSSRRRKIKAVAPSTTDPDDLSGGSPPLVEGHGLHDQLSPHLSAFQGSIPTHQEATKLKSSWSYDGPSGAQPSHGLPSPASSTGLDDMSIDSVPAVADGASFYERTSSPVNTGTPRREDDLTSKGTIVDPGQSYFYF